MGMTKTICMRNNAVYSGRMAALAAGSWFACRFPKAVNRVVISTGAVAPFTYLPNGLTDPGAATAMVAAAATTAVATVGSRQIGANEVAVLEFETAITSISIQNQAGGAVDYYVEGHIVGADV